MENFWRHPLVVGLVAALAFGACVGGGLIGAAYVRRDAAAPRPPAVADDWSVVVPRLESRVQLAGFLRDLSRQTAANRERIGDLVTWRDAYRMAVASLQAESYAQDLAPADAHIERALRDALGAATDSVPDRLLDGDVCRSLCNALDAIAAQVEASL